jgi:hypothetical protein
VDKDLSRKEERLCQRLFLITETTNLPRIPFYAFFRAPESPLHLFLENQESKEEEFLLHKNFTLSKWEGERIKMLFCLPQPLDLHFFKSKRIRSRKDKSLDFAQILMERRARVELETLTFELEVDCASVVLYFLQRNWKYRHSDLLLTQ